MLPPFSAMASLQSFKLGQVRFAQSEVYATLREAVLIPTGWAPVVPAVDGTCDVVVLVHGFLATAGVFRPMRVRLEEAGHAVASFTYAPGRSVDAIARRLAEVVDRIPASARVHVVGHSLGGVVARYYVQQLNGHRRVTQTVSLASPFHGTPRARGLAWLVGDLHPESRVLERVRACPPHVRVPHTSIIAGRDRLIPLESARFPGSPTVVLEECGHNALLFDPEVVRIVLESLRLHRAEAA
jgi:triacylglycerol lipase